MPREPKRPLDPRHLRRIPKGGFSWIDRRLLREGFAEALSGPELLLYFFLCTASDHDGLSFWGDRRAARMLKLSERSLEQARRGLMRKELILWQPPLYQVLPLPEAVPGGCLEDVTVKAAQRTRPRGAATRSVGEILGELM